MVQNISAPISLDKFEIELQRMGKSNNTVRVYSNNVRTFHAAGIPDPLDWLIEARNSGASPATLKARMAALRAWSLHTGDAATHTALCNYKLPTVGTPTPHPIWGGIAVVRAVLSTVTDPRVRVLISLGAFAGLRVSESLSVTGRSWDRTTNELVITGKGGKTRSVPVSTELAAILAVNQPVNPRSKLVNLQDRRARDLITQAFSKLGITHPNGEKIASHDLRATFATEVYQNTKDPLLVQNYLGHSDLKTTQVYLGIADSVRKSGVEF